jgi:hypothetical protein
MRQCGESATRQWNAPVAWRDDRVRPSTSLAASTLRRSKNGAPEGCLDIKPRGVPHPHAACRSLPRRFSSFAYRAFANRPRAKSRGERDRFVADPQTRSPRHPEQRKPVTPRSRARSASAEGPPSVRHAAGVGPRGTKKNDANSQNPKRAKSENQRRRVSRNAGPAPASDTPKPSA